MGDTVETVLIDKRLRWPDTFSEGPDGTMYLTASHIQDTQWFKPGALRRSGLNCSLSSLHPGGLLHKHLHYSDDIETIELDEQEMIDGIIKGMGEQPRRSRSASIMQCAPAMPRARPTWQAN